MPNIVFAADCGVPAKSTRPEKPDPNHDSTIDQDQMKRLVLQIRNLEAMGDNPNFPVGMDEAFKTLQECLASAKGDIEVVKGIHERDSKAHFTIKVNNNRSYHVFVVIGGTWGRIQTMNQVLAPDEKFGRDLFRYQVSGVSYQFNNNLHHQWPPVIAQNGQPEYMSYEKPLGRPRGFSYSVGNRTAPMPTTFAEIQAARAAQAQPPQQPVE